MPAPSSPPSLTTPPTAPSRDNAPATFITRMNAFLAWIVTFVSEMGTMATALYNYATSAYNDAATANTKAGEAASSATTANTKAGEASDHADDAEAAAAEAEAFLTQIQNIAAGISFTSTSTTSLTVGTGSKTWTVQAGESYAAGMPIAAVKNGDPNVYMVGICTSYSGTSLVVAVSQKEGSGTVADWNISVGGIPGPQPELGTASDVAALSSTTKAVSAGALGSALAFVDGGSGSGTYTPNHAAGPNHKRTVTGTTTVANLSNPKEGESFCIRLAQDATGSRSISFGSGYKFAGGAPSPSTAANSIDMISGVVVDASTPRFDCAYIKGFA